MLQSFVLQNSSLNFKSTKHENITHFTNLKGWKANTSGKPLLVILVIRTHFRQQIALFNGINTYETTLFCTFRFYLIPKSVFEVFIADPYVVQRYLLQTFMSFCVVNTSVMLVAVNVALFWEWLFTLCWSYHCNFLRKVTFSLYYYQRFSIIS